MKSLSIFLVLLSISLFSTSQQLKINWGDEFKLRRGSTELQVVYADNSGVYLEEGHLAIKSYFVIGATARSSASLIKLDNNLAELYRSDFNKELKGKEFQQIFMLRDKMLLIASDYIKSERTLEVYAAEIDKHSGELYTDWKQVGSFQKEEKKDGINFKIIPNQDSTKVVVVSSVEGKEKNNYQVQEFDNTLKATSRPISITNEFDPKTFQLEDVYYTVNKKIFLVGRVYEYQEGKKKKEKYLDFANYSIRLYNENGKLEKEINTTINGKWLISTKLTQKGDKDLVLCAFYSNAKKGKTIDGILVQRINASTGDVIATSEKEINNSMVTTDEEINADDANDEEETKAERKEREKLDKIKDEGEGFSKYMQFRNIFYTQDNGIIFLAEKYHHYTYVTQSYNPPSNGFSSSTTTTYYSVYECGDIMMCKVDAGGNINWLKILPKKQREVIAGSSTGFTMAYSFFETGNVPFYAGFGAMQNAGNIHLLFNDYPKNAGVTQPGQKVGSITKFNKADCFVVSLNEQNGKLSRSFGFSNKDVPTAMPRLGVVLGDNMYIVGKQDRLFSKTKIAVAKVKVN